MSNEMNEAAKLNYNDINPGNVYTFKKIISKQDVMDFAELSGDFNPLHVDVNFGKKSMFKDNVVHGMLAASLFSTLVGMHCPGEKSLYLSQTLNFKLPLYYDDMVTVRGIIISKNDGIKIITIKTEILKDDKIVIDGEAKVKVME